MFPGYLIESVEADRGALWASPQQWKEVGADKGKAIVTQTAVKSETSQRWVRKLDLEHTRTISGYSNTSIFILNRGWRVAVHWPFESASPSRTTVLW
jgi:hypothetical protein